MCGLEETVTLTFASLGAKLDAMQQSATAPPTILKQKKRSVKVGTHGRSRPPTLGSSSPPKSPSLQNGSPGDLRNGLFDAQWSQYSESVKKEKINKELNNGRAAMMGIFALMVHEGIDGKAYVLNEVFGLPQPY